MSPKLNKASCQRSFQALQEYIDIRTRMGVLEIQSNCNCSEFNTCDHCKEWQPLNGELQRIMNLWGDNWATMLWSYQEEISHLLTFEARRDGCGCGEGEACSFEHCTGYPKRAEGEGARK